MAEMRVVKKMNAEHSEVVKSERFQRHMSKCERENLLANHKEAIVKEKSLLTRLLLLSNNDLNADVNADIDDVLETWGFGKRLSRRLRKAYFAALARNYLENYKEDPLKIFGGDATTELLKISSIS
jgi:hypothetical protein